MGVWIETLAYGMLYGVSWSHPTWVCGLKLPSSRTLLDMEVTPYVGVWIETSHYTPLAEGVEVTPYVGVWIETMKVIYNKIIPLSHPTWVCGLKPKSGIMRNGNVVTPYVGVWIETVEKSLFPSDYSGSHPTWVCGLKRLSLSDI